MSRRRADSGNSVARGSHCTAPTLRGNVPASRPRARVSVARIAPALAGLAVQAGCFVPTTSFRLAQLTHSPFRSATDGVPAGAAGRSNGDASLGQWSSKR